MCKTACRSAMNMICLTILIFQLKSWLFYCKILSWFLILHTNPLRPLFISWKRQIPGHWSVTGTSRNDFFPGCFLTPGFLSGQNRRIPIGSYRFQKVPAEDRLENDRNSPKTYDKNPATKKQSKTARKQPEAAKTGGIRQGKCRNRAGFLRFRQLDWSTWEYDWK